MVQKNYKFKVKSIKKIDKELCKFMKVCIDCGELKLISNFSKKNTCKDGYRNQCRQCIKLKSLKYICICKQCGEEFKTPKKDQKFCSYECNYKWQKESDARKGEKNPNWSGGGIIIKCDYCGKEKKIKICNYNKTEHHFCNGECYSKYHGENMRGEKHPNWDFSLTYEEREDKRINEEYKQWRTKVYERDNYTCIYCGNNKGHNLNAHHLNNYKDYKDQRTDINNGVTLCEKCHKKFHRLYGYKNNTKEQFINFIFYNYIRPY